MNTKAHQSAFTPIKKLKKVTVAGAILLTTSLWNCQTNSFGPGTDSYQLDETTSVAQWKGTQPTGNAHIGTLTVKSDQLTVRDGKVNGGSFTMPLASLVDIDLPTEELKEQLIHHLQSVDFFNMAVNPTITYTITSVRPYSGNEGVAGANYQVSGNLTMLGKTRAVSFPAKIQVGQQLTVEASLKIDRTQWGMTYCADPTLPADRYILPDIDIQLKLIGNRNGAK